MHTVQVAINIVIARTTPVIGKNIFHSDLTAITFFVGGPSAGIFIFIWGQYCLLLSHASLIFISFTVLAREPIKSLCLVYATSLAQPIGGVLNYCTWSWHHGPTFLCGLGKRSDTCAWWGDVTPPFVGCQADVFCGSLVDHNSEEGRQHLANASLGERGHAYQTLRTANNFPDRQPADESSPLDRDVCLILPHAQGGNVVSLLD